MQETTFALSYTRKDMEIVLIGTGNVASILGRKLKLAGHTILQIYGRNAARASALAYDLDSESTNYWSVIRKDADVVLIAVSDAAVHDVAVHLSVPDSVVAHTAASLKPDVLRNCSPHYGVFYPLQSLHKDVIELPEISIVIQASTDRASNVLNELASSISAQNATLTDEQRLKLHVAAVLCNNFTNYLYTLAEDYCKKENLDFRMLFPLIRETAERLYELSPAKTQTGPAIRNDINTIRQHLDLLKKHPEIEKVYRFLSENISTHTF